MHFEHRLNALEQSSGDPTHVKKKKSKKNELYSKKCTEKCCVNLTMNSALHGLDNNCMGMEDGLSDDEEGWVFLE